GTEHSGIEVEIAVAPEGRAIAPDRVIVDVVIGERPEQRPDPAISAVSVPPPSLRAAMPADQRSACGKLSARDRIAEDARVPQRAVVRERIQRSAHITGTDRGGSDLMEASSAMPSEMMGAGKMTAAKMSTTTTTTMEMGVTAAVPTMTAAMTTAVTPTRTAAVTPTMTATMTAASRKRGAG